MTTTELAKNNQQRDFITDGGALVTKANSIVVSNPEEYAEARGFLGNVRDLKKKILEFIDPHIDRANVAHKALTADRRKMTANPDEALATVDGKLNAYNREKEHERQVEQARLQKIEEDKRIAEAAELEEVGDAEAAEEHLDAPMPVPQAPPAVPKLQDTVRIREKWTLKIVDATLIPDEYRVVDTPRLEALARTQKGAFSVAGCEAVRSVKHY